MKIQSLSIVVPNKSCVNNCAFCVSKMHCEAYKNQMDDNLPFFDLYLRDYIKRLEFARDNGCNTLMLTGRSEPQQNRKFLTYFGMMMQIMKNGLCVVIDGDCMDKAEKTDEDYKYLILQPDCKLYSQWDDPASLIF